MLYLGTETLLLCALLWVSCAYDGADWFPIPTLPAVLFGLTLPWAWVLICRYAPISRWWKAVSYTHLDVYKRQANGSGPVF